jgi:hypothetical protein
MRGVGFEPPVQWRYHPQLPLFSNVDLQGGEPITPHLAFLLISFQLVIHAGLED